MAGLSQEDRKIIKNHPLANLVDHLRGALQQAERQYAYDGADESQDQLYRNAISKLLSALQGEEAALNIRSRISDGNVASDIANLFTSLQRANFSYNHYRRLVHLVIQRLPPTESQNVETWNFDVWNAVFGLIDTVSRGTPPPPPHPTSSIQQTPWLRNTSSVVNSTEYRKHVDIVLKEELGEIHVDIPRFFDAYFGDIPHLTAVSQAVLEECEKGDSPLYHEDEGWKGWPELAAERDVLKWLANIIAELVRLAEAQEPSWKIDRRPLAQPSQPLQGSVAERKLDVGFVDDLTATEDSRCLWSQILVPGGLKNDPKYDRKSGAWFDLGRYAREVLAAQDTRHFVLGFTLCGPFLRLWNFDRLGGIASEEFNINQDGLRFMSVILGFLLMNRKQLGFDPTIVTTGTERYIEIEKNGTKERLIIDEIVGRARCVAGRATTCWKVYCETDKSRTPLVVKDSWQYPERTEEGELLREAMAKGVKNVARYYHHETVRIDDKDDDVLAIRKGLSIPISKDEKGGFKATVRRSRSQREQKRQGSSTGQKRSSDCVDMAFPPPPSKRTQSSSPSKSADGSTRRNRIHRRIVIRDCGKPIYESSSKSTLLTGLAGCIEGYMSLHDEAGLIQCDVSPRNLMVNEDKDNPSWPAFLIDLDLAIKTQRDGSSGARGKTGTRAFMAIGVLYGEKHCFMHDLESFFWVLFWICIHYDAPGKGRIVERFEEWNYVSTEKLADEKKGVISDEGDFLRILKDNFTPYYQSLIPCVNRLRRLVFPDGGRWKKSNFNLPRNMIETLQDAQYNSVN
ncbi:hypothetical protein PAAG_04212 [Paracoccidioides lutzii Pb01]|uniref:Fungal-type protein kinase domain-containing protein n=1 Tax=Paracoccidioides lutzii (strain ATCC MYA-826 / Pb01) TaxID=502779 RepID=C1H0B8_PARBA|nr:hypothetical protein PAAG_04212 [Paracoccidioides lutzii Pb01]EEH33159.1 hypothetical protein PAAG_04212 [Paracoccidioides lutzii Pb01]